MVDKVASEVAVPWTPLDSIAAAFSSYEIKSSDATSVNGKIIMDDNATAAALWMLMKPYVEVVPFINDLEAKLPACLTPMKCFYNSLQ